MRPIDIRLAAGDTLPTSRLRLEAPTNEDGTPGDPVPLDTATSIVLRYQPRNGSAAWVTLPAVAVAPAATSMMVDVAWSAPVPPGEYFARVIAFFPGGDQLSFPDGDDEGNDDDSFMRMHVARDFVTVP